MSHGMKTVESQGIRHGMVLGDGFVVDGVYMTIGSAPRCYWATGKRWGVVESRQFLGPFGNPITVKS